MADEETTPAVAEPHCNFCLTTTADHGGNFVELDTVFSPPSTEGEALEVCRGYCVRRKDGRWSWCNVRRFGIVKLGRLDGI